VAKPVLMTPRSGKATAINLSIFLSMFFFDASWLTTTRGSGEPLARVICPLTPRPH
jgi:hypothetical protein